MNQSSHKILSCFNLSKTTIRTSILELLLRCDCALSVKEMEEELGCDVDRVTMYRAIKLFVDKGVIHKVVVNDQLTKYTLINQEHGIWHPHFHCVQCDRVMCLPDVSIPKMSLPKGFRVASQNILLEGTCASCEESV